MDPVPVLSPRRLIPEPGLTCGIAKCWTGDETSDRCAWAPTRIPSAEGGKSAARAASRRPMESVSMLRSPSRAARVISETTCRLRSRNSIHLVEGA